MRSCCICPRCCGVDRLEGETGYCNTGKQAVVASFNPHFGEETPLVGNGGSGTVFFTHCNLLCTFCQNYDISHGGEGIIATDEEIAGILIRLKKQGCININCVTPTHVVPQILAGLKIAVEHGLDLPLVYNTGGYDSVDTLKCLDGIVDIYMPDFKFWDAEIAESTCNAPDYREVACAALKEMHRQVGDLELDDQGNAVRGLLVRHLVLPEDLAGTRQVMNYLYNEISPDTYVNIMPQYRPCGRAFETPSLSRSLTTDEFRESLRIAGEEGIYRLDKRLF